MLRGIERHQSRLHSTRSDRDDVLLQTAEHTVQNHKRRNLQRVLIDHEVGVLKIELWMTQSTYSHVLRVFRIVKGYVEEVLIKEGAKELVLLPPLDHVLRAFRHHVSRVNANNHSNRKGATAGSGHMYLDANRCFIM